MAFWKWFFGGIPKIPHFFYLCYKIGVLEYIFSMILGVLASVMLSMLYSPLWLILTVPVTIFGMAHGFWNMENYMKAKFKI
jgi:hypothetical protein